MAGFTANEESFIVFNSEKKLVIPFFQRKYVWKESNWSELFDNFFKKDKPGFLGSILVQRSDISAGKGGLDVIDGQQRLTTISILIMAIYDSIENSKKENAKDEILDALFSKETFQNNYTTKLIHSRFDREDYETIMDFEKDIEEIKNKKDGIIGCYNFFMDRLSGIPDDKKVKVLSEFLEGTYLIWVVITLDKDMDEQSIFDTLNNSGVSLTSADTIKNYIFKRAIELYDEKFINNQKESLKEVIKLYDKNWEAAFSNKDEDIEQYWDREVTTGRIKRTNIDLFLYCFAVIKDIFSQYDNNISELAKTYKEYLEKEIKNEKQFNKFLKELKTYADKFRLYFENNTNEIFYSYNKEDVLPRLLHLLKVNDVTTFHPYILNVLCKFENDTKYRNEQLHMLEKYLIINYLNQDSTKIKNYNKFCITIIKDGNKLKKDLEEIEKDIKYTLLNNISNSFATYFLFWIELHRKKEMDDETSLSYSYTLEHVMPIKWRENWYSDVEKGLKDEKGVKLSTFDSIQYRDNHLRMLGNMTLLKGKLNSSASNDSYSKKIEKIKEHASLRITKEDIVDRYYTKDKSKAIKVWNEKVIEERTTKLKNEIIEALLY